MLIVELPAIPMVSVLSGRIFKRVILSWFVHSAGRRRGLEDSQRQICSKFNRSNQLIISKYLKEAREENYLELLTPSDGLNPDVHIRGAFFVNRTRDSDRLIQLANSLWGPQRGLLRHWPYPSAWGHGCTPPAAIVCLATLRILDEPIQKKTLRKYLEPLVSDSSFNDAIRWMRGKDLIVLEACGITVSKDWQEKFVRHLVVSPAGNNRQERGDCRRTRESFVNRVRVKKATITRLEQDALKRLPCVWKGCKNQATEMEHFPAHRFLRHLGDQTNRHLVWAICEKHNDATQSFIKYQPSIPTDISSGLFIDARYSKWDVYEAVSDINIQRFYAAARGRDDKEANVVIGATVALLNAIVQSTEPVVDNYPKRKKAQREMKGVNAYLPGLSKL
jgi:hypothetical protein